MRILLIEPHQPLARALQRGLEEEEFAVEMVHDKETGDGKVQTKVYDAIVLDLNSTGLESVLSWRRGGLTTPVLLLTQPSGADALPGRHLGVCDAVTKPFHLEELLARLRALLYPVPRGRKETASPLPW